MKYLSQFLQCLHWEGFHSAWAFMCIFKLCPLENILAHISHLESLSPESSGHVDLQTLPTWENFCTASAYMPALSPEIRPSPSVSFMCIFKLFPQENVLAHSSHAEGLSSVCSDHMDLQTLLTTLATSLSTVISISFKLFPVYKLP